VTLSEDQEAQRARARQQLAEALAAVRAAELEIRPWASLSIQSSLTALQAELQTILARL
jgi:hypothetical protein